MPRVFRVLLQDAEGKPTLAPQAGLNVRLGIESRQDAQGYVIQASRRAGLDWLRGA
jgi:hypothetical protein